MKPLSKIDIPVNYSNQKQANPNSIAQWFIICQGFQRGKLSDKPFDLSMISYQPLAADLERM